MVQVSGQNAGVGNTDARVETSRGELRVEVMARRRSSARGESLEQTELAGLGANLGAVGTNATSIIDR